jgi:class 3 adenylate cyclase
MWQFTIHTPDKEPTLVELKPGTLTLGRAPTNNIVIDDVSASRKHAEIVFDPATNTVTLIDLKSTNGTYINHQRITGTYQLAHDDLVRIGQFLMHLMRSTGEIAVQPMATGTHRFTRELLLESLDEHSVLIDDVARKLNMVVDIDTAMTEVTSVLKVSMGVEICEVILAEQLKDMETSDFMDPLARRAANTCSAEVTPTSMFVPIMRGEDLIGLISMRKTRSGTRPFGRRDLQLAVAISHQASMAIQRMQLIDIIRREEQMKRLLLRFVSPTEAEFLLKDYFENGELPGLKEQKVTVMFSDIANSTRLAEYLGTKHFSKILNSFYREATQIVFHYNGMVKYLGDGILAIFPEDVDGIPTEEKAVLAAKELLGVVNRTGSLDPEQRVIIGVAINTGEAMVGYVGTKERAEFNVLGDIVNVAYRMQDYARPYKIIVGPATVAAISNKYYFRRVGAVSLRGREQTVQAYEVLTDSKKFVT